METTRIVVGVSGSSGSIAAVRWAAAEARLRDVELRVVAAYHGRPAHDVVRSAVGQARTAAPDVDVRGVALPGYAVPVLLKAGETAALLVVGDRGGGALPGLPFGAVAGRLATQARCSVVVVRGERDRAAGPVVVGVDDSPAADSVIGRAFEEAALRHADVLAITAGGGAAGQAGQDAGGEADSRLDPWRSRYRSVAARREFVGGRPDRAMVQSCRQARLAVVGPRRHGYQGVMLGAIGTELLRSADCPVLIAR